MRQLFLPQAIADLEKIGDYIARDAPRRAASFVTELRRRCVKIAGNPAAYRLRPELAEGILSWAYENYVIFFTAHTDTLSIIRVLHGAMDIESHFGQPPEN